MEAARQYDVHEVTTHFSRVPQQVEADEEIVISGAGVPVAEVVPLRPEVDRTDYGVLRGQIRIAEDFDVLPDDIADAFGVHG
jgi:antitoxin (DNA-binding transcriptional repressor) of toxin-antitoxin stability system